MHAAATGLREKLSSFLAVCPPLIFHSNPREVQAAADWNLTGTRLRSDWDSIGPRPPWAKMTFTYRQHQDAEEVAAFFPVTICSHCFSTSEERVRRWSEQWLRPLAQVDVMCSFCRLCDNCWPCAQPASFFCLQGTSATEDPHTVSLSLSLSLSFSLSAHWRWSG